MHYCLIDSLVLHWEVQGNVEDVGYPVPLPTGDLQRKTSAEGNVWVPRAF